MPTPMPRMVERSSATGWRKVSASPCQTLPVSVPSRATLSRVTIQPMISEMANRPTVTGTRPMPDCSSRMPKAKRASPITLSTPTKERQSPRQAITMPFTGASRLSTATTERPSIASAKYSAGLNSLASASSGSVSAMTASMPKTAPNRLAPMESPIATRARPWRAIG
jgi:hypothetical protein